jgi:hypothetical protein
MFFLFRNYNEGMGGVDLLDNLVACYRVLYRIKKWWFPIFIWSLSVCAVNGWRLRMKMTGQKEPFLNFLRELCIEMLSVHGSPPSLKRTSLSVIGDARYDQLGHWVANTEQDAAGKFKRRNCKMCALLKKADFKTVYLCEKCQVPLHVPGCFKEKDLCLVFWSTFGLEGGGGEGIILSFFFLV